MGKFEFAKILLVEDDPGDQKLISAALKVMDKSTDVIIVGSGEEGLKLLNECCEGKRNSKPQLILLDLNTPGMGGFEFLKEIKKNDKLKYIPVVVLTSSDAEKDIIESYQNQAAGYVKKPGDSEQIQLIMNLLVNYWFTVCILPK